MRVDALDDLTVELQYEAQDAVSRRMLGPEIEGEVAQVSFGHNGLASAAGSTLAADAGSRSIGFQFHRTDLIDAARTGSATQNTFGEFLRNTPPITIRYGLTFPSGRMRPARARSSGSETLSLIRTKVSAHTGHYTAEAISLRRTSELSLLFLRENHVPVLPISFRNGFLAFAPAIAGG